MRDLILLRRSKDLKHKGQDYEQTYYTLVVTQSDKEVEVIKFLTESDLLELQEQIKEVLNYKVTSKVLK